jgi:hypothetical protein
LETATRKIEEICHQNLSLIYDLIDPHAEASQAEQLIYIHQ